LREDKQPLRLLKMPLSYTVSLMVLSTKSKFETPALSDNLMLHLNINKRSFLIFNVNFVHILIIVILTN